MKRQINLLSYCHAVKKVCRLVDLAGVASLAAWWVVVFFIDPTQTGVLGIILFYATLACAVFALVLLLGLAGRMLLKTPT